MRRTIALAVLVALFSVSCGGSELTLTEYSEEIAALLGRVDTRLDAHADALAAAPPDVAATQAYFADRVSGYHEMVDGVAALDPPEEIEEIHTVLQEILRTLLEAEAARAAFAATLTSTDQLDQAWEGPEAQAVRAAEIQAIELCHAAQQQIDETGEREELEGVLWVPPELREVVLVSFNCPPPVDEAPPG